MSSSTLLTGRDIHDALQACLPHAIIRWCDLDAATQAHYEHVALLLTIKFALSEPTQEQVTA